jgi:hypothetical protein
MASTPVQSVIVPDLAWSDDVAQGTQTLYIEVSTHWPVLVQFGAAKPDAAVTNGLTIEGKGAIWLGAPHFAAGDKVFLRSRLGEANVQVSRG